jgi:FkbM family methyltransferase
MCWSRLSRPALGICTKGIILVNPFTEGLFTAEYAESPFVYVDVGARGGIDRRWRPFKKHFQTVLLEADEGAYQELIPAAESNPALKPIFATLHNTPGTIKFHITRKADCSSVIPPNRQILDQFPDSKRFDVLSTLSLEATTLDFALQENGINEIDFLKIDAQGSGLPILEGGRQALEGAYGVEVETEFTPLYEGQPLFNEVDCFMRSNGFELFDINRFYWKRPNGGSAGRRRGQLVFGDALYLRSPEEFVKRIADHAKGKVIKATLISLAYGYPDLAVAIWDRALEQAIVNRDEHQRAVAYLERDGRGATWLTKIIPVRLKVARVMQQMVDLMLRGGPYDCDGRLGNTPK